jgi:hypothetical protein
MELHLIFIDEYVSYLHINYQNFFSQIMRKLTEIPCTSSQMQNRRATKKNVSYNVMLEYTEEY